MSKPPVPTTLSPYWQKQAELRRIREANDILAEQQEESDRLATVPLEPCRIPPECRSDIVVKPGNQHAQAAFKAGREDEYIDRMKSRYGGEW
jgi:hypothetical protein